MTEEETVRKPKEKNSHASLICALLSIVTLATVVLGFYYHNPFIVIAGILPAAIYETIRTEGIFTKIGSGAILALVILEILALKGIIRINLADVMEQSQIYFSGYVLPLGDIVFIFPAVSAVISFILLVRTYGPYTKWLAVLLLISSISVLYMVSKQGFFELLRSQYYYF